MGLSGQQRKELQNALIDAFPNTTSLEQMLSFELDKNLRAITGEGSLKEIVFQLIRTADAEGWIKNLVRAALNDNPGNQKLIAITNKLRIHDSTTNNTNEEDAIAEYRLKVKEFAEDGEISYAESEILKDLQKKLKLTEEEVRTIRDEVLEPFGTSTALRLKKKNLQNRLADLEENYKGLEYNLRVAGDADEKNRLQLKLKNILKEIEEIEKELNQINHGE